MITQTKILEDLEFIKELDDRNDYERAHVQQDKLLLDFVKSLADNGNLSASFIYDYISKNNTRWYS